MAAAPSAPIPPSHPARWIATLGGVGFWPKAPGTYASLLTLPVAYLFASAFSSYSLIGLAFIVFLLGWWAGGIYAEATGREDPPEVVIDEVAGQLLTLALTPPSLLGYAIGFAVFRLFDIWKPFPVSWLDRNVKGGLGVMADDLAAGIYVLIIMWLGAVIAKSV